jgi:uncharacterized protein
MSEISLEDRARALENEYFHKREQELIEKLRAKLSAENKDATGRRCLKCDGTMVETTFADVKMDVCNKCHGVWLDAGELSQILHKKESGGSNWIAK